MTRSAAARRIAPQELRRRRRHRPLREPPRWLANHPPERFAEGALRLVAERGRDRRDWLVARGEPLGREQHAPAGQVLRGGLSDDLLEAEREDGARRAS